jgi:hypothetical protein
VDLTGQQLILEPGHVRKIWRDHGPDSNDPQPLSRLDFELIPHVWREPDQIRRGDALLFEKDLLGRTVVVAWSIPRGGQRFTVQTLYQKRP